MSEEIVCINHKRGSVSPCWKRSLCKLDSMLSNRLSLRRTTSSFVSSTFTGFRYKLHRCAMSWSSRDGRKEKVTVGQQNLAWRIAYDMYLIHDVYTQYFGSSWIFHVTLVEVSSCFWMEWNTLKWLHNILFLCMTVDKVAVVVCPWSCSLSFNSSSSSPPPPLALYNMLNTCTERIILDSLFH